LTNAERIEVGFNEAFKPPWAFTDFATCPLPPQQIQLALVIGAGSSNTSARIRLDARDDSASPRHAR
jgi:uncharacterized protein (DUF1684 family)